VPTAVFAFGVDVCAATATALAATRTPTITTRFIVASLG
jgi:hypothetical protein